jgi:hypothetical protein
MNKARQNSSKFEENIGEVSQKGVILGKASRPQPGIPF